MDKITLETFAGKKFAIYGLGFKGENVKEFPRDTYNYALHGYNIKNGKRWGEFSAYYSKYTLHANGVSEHDDIIFNYSKSENPLYIRGLRDRNFRKIAFLSLPNRITDAVVSRTTVKVEDILTIAGTAYWHKIWIGKFWMVEVA